MKIRFRAIKRVAEDVLNREVEIHLSSQLIDRIGCIAEINHSLHILINSNIVKTEEQVIAVVIHELAHVKSKSFSHTNLFYSEQEKLVKIFSKRLGVSKDILRRLLVNIHVYEKENNRE